MTVVFRDEFSGYTAPATSGAAPFTATDNVEQFIFIDFEGTPTTGDKVEYTMTFPGGTVTFRARWSSSTTLVLERVSTIAGTSNGTATLQTFTSTSTSKPRTDGDLVRMGFKVNRGAVNAITAITFTWHARSSFAGAAQTTNSFNIDGELTPTAATFSITGTSFRNRNDLEGRSPDTVGSGTYTWGQQAFGQRKQSGATVIERYDINGLVAENDLQPFRTAENAVDVVYPVTGGMSFDALTVRTMATCASGEFPTLNLGAKWDPATRTGLIGWIAYPGIVTIGTYTAGSYDGDYDSVGLGTDLDDDTPHLIEFVVDDVSVTAQVLIDSVPVFSPPVDISAGPASSIGPGGAALGMWRSDRTIAGLSVSEFEVEDAGVVAPPTDAYLVSQHEFYSERPAVIGSVVTDSYPFSGTVTKHPESATDISQDASEGALLGAGRAIYLDSNIQYSCDGDTVPLGDDYCADVVASLPARTSPGTGSVPFNEPWRYRITRSPGTPFVQEEGLVSDLIGFSGAISTGADGTMNFSDLDVWPNGQPKSFAVDWDGPGTGGAYVQIIFFTRGYNPSAESKTYTLAVNWEVDEGAIEVTPRAEPPFGLFSTFGLFWHFGGAYHVTYPMGPQNIGPDHYYPPFYFPDGNPGTQSETVSLAAAAFDIAFEVATGGSNNTNATVHELSEIEYDNVSYTEGSNPTEDDGGEYAEVETLVRYDQTTDTGYGLRFIFDHTNYPSDPLATCILFERDNGVETRLLPVFDASPGFHSLVQIRLCVAGTMLSASFPGGSAIGTFDYATDDADETSAPVDAHDTGDPGFGGLADQPGDLRFEQFNVYEPAGCDDEPPKPPCTCLDCPEVNGHPPYPPPPPPPLYGFWTRQNLQWRFVHLPDAVDPVSDAHASSNLLRRPVQILMPRANLAYRTLAADPYTGGGITYYPPGPEPKFDPCLLLPPVVLPPGTEIGAPPARLFFSWNIGGAQLGPLWTACFRAMGASIRSEITAAASHGGAIYGTPGDKSKFFRGGRYAEDLMLSWIASLAAIPGFVDFILDAQDAGSFAGVHAADDWENAMLWPPSGLSMTQLNRIGQIWKAYFVDGSRTIRVFIRARSGQLSGELPSLDGLISQMRMTGREWDAAGRDAGTYAQIELDYCQIRGWRLHLSQNFFHGPGSVTAIMSPTVVLANATAWNDVIDSHPWGHAVDGEGGWEYSSPITGTPYFSALAAWRNQLQALGAPS